MKKEASLIKNCMEKFNSKNKVDNQDYNLPIDEFLMTLYSSCDPQAYGKQFPKKLLKDVGTKLNLFEMPDKIDEGDLGLIFPTYSPWEFCEGRNINTPDGKKNINVYKKITFEAKLSYLNRKEKYGIRQIRLYQDFDFFILCFVDCKDDFLPQFTCVKQNTIEQLFTLTPMNGTKKANEKNGNVPYSATVSKGSEQMDLLFGEYNLLNGTTYNHLLNFLSQKNIDAIMSILKSMPYDIQELIKLNSEEIKRVYKFIHDISIEENCIEWCMKRKQMGDDTTFTPKRAGYTQRNLFG